MLQESKLNRISTPVQVKIPEQVEWITCGSESTFCITTTKKVYTWGMGVGVPTLLQIPPVDCLTASKEHWFAWSQTQVFGWGSNKSGKLGMNTSMNTPTLFDIFSEASQYGWQLQKIAVGLDHSVALIEVEDENKIFVWGSNTYQQLGFDASEQCVAIPHQLDLDNLPRITDVYAQHNYTMAIDEDGRVFSWGSNEFGRLGQNTYAKHMKLPSQIPSLKNISVLALGTFHVLAVDTQGAVFSWGRGLQGQLGHGNGSDISIPKVISQLQGIVSVACGEAHSVVLGNQGSVWVFGSGQFGQLGLGDFKQYDTPQMLQQQTAEMIACGRHHTALLSKQLLTFGNNDQGQLGMEAKIGAYQTPLPKQHSINTNQIFELTDELMNKIESDERGDLDSGKLQQLLKDYQEQMAQFNTNQTALFVSDLMQRVVALLKRN